MEPKVMIKMKGVTVRFNLAKERVDNLKEYCIKMFKGELFFQEFLALQNVNLTVHRGEAWGIVGRNGSGKSTLLKVISGILRPWKGSVKRYGTLAPLIELSAGVDGNLTGRENIYLNGALLGYDRRFMTEHFDEIVDFAEIHKFLDVPVKNYSSGMKARLGFSVATLVRPEILIVDEVLAVGDKDFQQKCMKRMQEMLAGDTTLLFVSHNNAAIRKLCQKAVWLEHGKVVMSGDVSKVCEAYEAS